MLGEESLLSCENISFSYGKRNIFSEMNFKIRPKEFWVISGESGVGKSTLLKVMTGELQAQTGKVTRPANWAEVPQGLGLCPGLSAYETVAAGGLQDLQWWQSLFFLPDAVMSKAAQLSKKLKIDHVLNHDVSRLSGGERQRVAMARSLMGKSRLFIVDEPISMLDENRALEALMLLQKEVFDRDGALVCVLHQSQIIQKFATHQLIMSSDLPQGWSLK